MTIRAVSPALIPRQDDHRLLVRTALRYLPARVVPALVGGAALPALGWFLAPSEFGTLALVSAALPFVALVGDWAVAGYQRHALVTGEVEAQTTVWVILLGGGAAVMLTIAGLVIGDTAAIALGLLVCPYLVNRMQWTKLQMTGHATAYSALQVFYTITRAGGMVAAAILTHRAVGALASWLLTSLAVVLVGPRMRLDRVPRLPAFTELAKVGMPLVVAAVAIHSIAVADRFIIAALEGHAAAGVYAFGYLITEGTLALPASVAYLACYWLATRAFDEGRRHEAFLLMTAVLRLQIPLAVLGVAAVSLAGPTVLHMFAPPEYRTAAPVLALIAAAAIPAGIVPYLVLLATLRRETARAVMPSALVAVANVALTIPAVYLAGVVGAAAATAATYALYCVFLVRWLLPNVSAAKLGRAVLVAGAAAAGMALTDSIAVILILGAVSAAFTVRAVTGSRWAALNGGLI